MDRSAHAQKYIFLKENIWYGGPNTRHFFSVWETLLLDGGDGKKKWATSGNREVLASYLCLFVSILLGASKK